MRLFAIALLVVLSTPQATSPLAGTYKLLDSRGGTCKLRVDASGGFVQSCSGRLEVRGVVERLGNLVALQRSWFAPLEPDESAQHDAALQTYMDLHLREHGHYPLVLPPRWPDDPDHMRCLMVAVMFEDHVYLVDIFQRDAFCTAANAGQPPSTGSPPHRLFVRPARQGERTDPSWRAFCTPGWAFRVE